MHITMDSNQCDDSEIEELILLGVISDYIDKHITKILCRTLAQGGEEWVHHVLNGNPRRCQEQFRMTAPVFRALEKWAC